jgi:hypothetical protein
MIMTLGMGQLQCLQIVIQVRTLNFSPFLAADRIRSTNAPAIWFVTAASATVLEILLYFEISSQVVKIEMHPCN